ncbi:MAG TPA: hypothetical protein VFE24_07930 [Pirellulales bacterium]|jgi:hypothetical protein|nr:hypothetical protein [Pirellulales bacterium]
MRIFQMPFSVRPDRPLEPGSAAALRQPGRLVLGASILFFAIAQIAPAAKSGTANDAGASKPAHDAKKPADHEVKAQDRGAISPDHEAVAMSFVRMNHAELADVLAELKASKPAEYAAAIADLYKVSEHLTQIQATNPARYTLELEAWKIKSRIQLLAARETMSSDEQFKAKLRTALEDQAENRLKLLKLDRAAAADRVKRLDAQIEIAENEQNATVQRQLDSLLRSIEKMRVAGVPDKHSANQDRPVSEKTAPSKNK